ncbi:MAG TPA: hypothetical protein VKB18_10060 [Gemmatimonadota bacterium]|nr:hypothetical protein [Gemmatimonadota bacterium]
MDTKHPLARSSHSYAAVCLALVLAAAACGGSTGPGSGGAVVTFDLGTESFAAAGDIAFGIEGRPVPDEDWAVAADPDSVGGIVVTAFRASETFGQGDLFVLQVQPAHTGTFAPCGPDEPCRGRLFRGWSPDTNDYDSWFEITSGTVDVEALTRTRIRGTFTFTVRSDGGSGADSLAITDGAFDVPVDGRVGGFVCGLPPSNGCLQ